MKLRSKPHLFLTLLVSFSIFTFALTNSGIISADDSLPGAAPASLEAYTETPTPENTSGEGNATDSGESLLTESPADSGLEPTQTSSPEPVFSQTPIDDADIVTETPTEIPTPTASATPDESMQWSLQIDAISKSVYSQASALACELQSQGLESELSAQGSGLYSMTINGEDGVEEIRDVLYGELGDAVSFIGGSAEITIEMPLESTREINIALESNPSTGYEWQIVQAESEGVGMGADSAYLGRGGIGAPDMVTLSLKPAQIGSAAIRLVYKRPFEPEPQITRHLTIRFSQPVDKIDLSDPNPAGRRRRRGGSAVSPGRGRGDPQRAGGFACRF
jgi:Predicted secreted protein